MKQIQTHQHEFVQRNGFKVCKNCGLVGDKIQFHTPTAVHHYGKKKRREIKVRFDGDIDNNLKRVLSRDWNDKTYIKQRVSRLLSHLARHLNEKQIEFIKRRIGYVQNRTELHRKIYEIIVKHDLPITTKKVKHILKSYAGKKFREYNLNLGYMRKYFWLINKLTHIPNISNEERVKAYRVIYNYYIYIRFKLRKNFNPPNLIRALTYIYFKHNCRTKVKLSMFNLAGNVISSRLQTFIRENEICDKIPNTKSIL